MDDQPTEDKGDNKKPVFSNLSSEDIKLLAITFAGTVAANLVTVVLVGLAIAAARGFDFAHAPLINILFLPVVASLGIVVVPIVVFTALPI